MRMPPPKGRPPHLQHIADALFAAFWRGLRLHYPGAVDQAWLTAHGLTHRSLAKAIGCNPYTVQSILARKAIDHRTSTLIPIAAWVGESIDSILGMEEARPANGPARPTAKNPARPRSGALYA